MVRMSPEEAAVADYQAFREIHRSGSGFVKAPWHLRIKPQIVSEETAGISAMSDPQVHGVRRRLFAQAFSKTRILFWADTIKAKIHLAVSKIKRDAVAGQADVFKWWTFMASDVISELAFGQAFDTLTLEKVCVQSVSGVLSLMTCLSET